MLMIGLQRVSYLWIEKRLMPRMSRLQVNRIRQLPSVRQLVAGENTDKVLPITQKSRV